MQPQFPVLIRRLFAQHPLRWVSLFFFLLTIFSLSATAGVSVTPNFLFMDNSRRSISFTVSNTDKEEVEVWIEAKYGYETSDEKGNIYIHLDTSNTDGRSAAQFLQPYPQRFVLGAGSSQIVRLIVNAQRELTPGEYWARVLVTNKPRNRPAPGQVQGVRPGINMMFQQSLPFLYRIGTVSTGLQVSSINAQVADTSVNLTLQLARTGNASYWGTRTIRILDRAGRAVSSLTKNVGVFTNITLIDKINRKTLVPGDYTIEVEFATERRTDINKSQLVQTSPIRVSTPLTIPGNQ